MLTTHVHRPAAAEFFFWMTSGSKCSILRYWRTSAKLILGTSPESMFGL